MDSIMETNTLTELPEYANYKKYGMKPVIVNKEIMIKLNKLEFITTGSRGGFVTDIVSERAYVTGYIKTDIAKILNVIMNTNGKIFQYIPLKDCLNYIPDDNSKNMINHQQIPVTLMHKKELGEYQYIKYIGPICSSEIKKYVTDNLYANLLENYSHCCVIDPVFGRLFDDKDNGLVTKLCDCLTAIQSNN